MQLKEAVIAALRQVYDPEISINVFDLGLIYSIEIEGTHCHVEHTLTSMMCPFADEICVNITEAVKSVEGIETVKRDLVFNPPFTMDSVPEETKILMGWD